MPRVIDHDERRRQIISVARELMLEGGFAAATMRGIASAAGFANGALKHYFDGKEAIVAATFDSVLVEMSEVMPGIVDGGDPADDLRAFVEAALPLDSHRIGAARVLLALWEYSLANEELSERYQKHLQLWRQELSKRLARVVAAGPETDAVQALASEVITMSIGANVASLFDSPDVLIARYQGYVDDFLARLVN